VASGVGGLDPLIGGGFLKGKTFLVTGISGTGKTIFGMQFLLQGIKDGENGIFITTDEKPESLIEDAASLGWDFRSLRDSNKLAILDITHHFEDLRAKRSMEVDIRKIVADLERYTSEVNAERIVIDPIAPLVIHPETDIRDYIRRLVFSLEGLGCTFVITSNIPVGSAGISMFGVEELFASGVIKLGFLFRENRYDRTLLIHKMRSTPISLNVHTYTIKYGEGISIIK